MITVDRRTYSECMHVITTTFNGHYSELEGVFLSKPLKY